MQLRDSSLVATREPVAKQDDGCALFSAALIAGMVALAAGPLRAQGESATEAAPTSTQPPPQPQPQPPAALRFARIEVEKQPVRCFANENSPLYLDEIAQGAVVQVGEPSGDFVAVTLPLGVTGYVHKKFATEPDQNGFVRTNGKRVSFRYRPRSTEAPADALDDGVALHFMGDEGDWYLVRNPRTVGYVPTSVLSMDLEAGAAAQAWSQLETARRAEWEQQTKARIEAAKQAEKLAQNRAALQEIVGKFGAEAGKPWETQEREAYVALEASAQALSKSFDDGSTEHLTLASLGLEIRKQIVVLDAQVVAKEKLPPPSLENSIVKPTVEDPLARFDLVGWVRVVNTSLANRGVRLIRGGRILGYLTCANERYDLAMFEGVEVGVIGPREAAADGTWVLDVQRMEVLGVPIR